MPKFTIRQLLFSIVIFAFIFAIFGWAVRGNIAAYGLGVAIFGLAIPFLCYAVLYFAAKMLQSYGRGSEVPKYSIASQVPNQQKPEKDN